MLSPLGENEDDDEKDEPEKGRNACPGGRHRSLRVHVFVALVKCVRFCETGERRWWPSADRARVSGLMPRATIFSKPISTVFAARIKHSR